MAKKALINKQQGQPEVPGARVHALPAVRAAARRVQAVHALPHLLPSARAPGRAPGGHEVVMVTKAKFSSNVTDPVADLLTRIRNANLAYKDELVAPVSKLNESRAEDPGGRGLHRAATSARARASTRPSASG